MPVFMSLGRYSESAIKGLLAKPEDRTAAVTKLVEKAGGKLIDIDGGFSKAYQRETGIAGYTLIYNSYGLLLVSHYPFVSTQKAIEEEIDIHSDTRLIERGVQRLRVGDTDLGRTIQRQIDELRRLLAAYRDGYIKERP